MIYMVEIDFTSEAHFDEWNAWYFANLPLMLTVPGFDSAQRLERVGPGDRRFLAIYTISDAGVFESEAYRAVGGGGKASTRWKEHIRRRRNLFVGIDEVPEVAPGTRLAVLDGPPLNGFTSLTVADIDMTPPERQIALLPEDEKMNLPGLRYYVPLQERLLPTGA